ncbi:MAG TPA: Smr/MutS family protein [Hypericibacter adhaerens]|jgi:DNA-nicking Smr family endonuclease|uniref:Smr/MutS family protein n=1 Tax=Hypericibacter adhaerens TaxID=2602016 RepID=UPI00177BC836|nr:Smr/MutS family protein [Hypericibacter adhaerens]HWA41976.1 Smr/MutS family protein [Hypericibacter adhaerens]
MTTRKPSADEQALFREAMQGTKPIARKKRVAPAATPTVTPASAVTPAKAGAHASTGGDGTMDPRFRGDDERGKDAKSKGRPVVLPPPPPPKAPTLETGRIADLDKRTGERFKRGEMAIDAKIDLHGFTQAEAHDRLQAFLAKAAESGKRCVLIVTGKGAGGWGVLRDSVPRWLNEPAMRRHLLAFAQAQARHGGAGALYALLKRKRAP